jgi:hypothetical protein
MITLLFDFSGSVAKRSHIECAAPFRPLPFGAKEYVDIQFSFDRKEFGVGHGTLISF